MKKVEKQNKKINETDFKETKRILILQYYLKKIARLFQLYL